MKRFLSLLLAALMLISCSAALAETERYKELGFAIDFSAVQNQSVNYPYMKNYGVIKMEPFTSVMDVAYFGLPRNIIETIDSMDEDSEGRILTFPIRGAAVKDYEPTIDKLLAGDAINNAPETGSAKNESGEYRVIVYDTEGNPVKGVIVQLCDESTCSFQKTKADGIATFQVDAPKVYDVHVGKVPAGYVSSDETYRTQDTFSDVNIFISKAE